MLQDVAASAEGSFDTNFVAGIPRRAIPDLELARRAEPDDDLLVELYSLFTDHGPDVAGGRNLVYSDTEDNDSAWVIDGDCMLHTICCRPAPYSPSTTFCYRHSVSPNGSTTRPSLLSAMSSETITLNSIQSITSIFQKMKKACVIRFRYPIP